MTTPKAPLDELAEPEDLLLLRRDFTRRPGALRLPADPRYGEICAWVTVEAGPDDVFSPEGQMLLSGEHSEGQGWRLWLDEYGYLGFASGEGEEQIACQSKLPLHCYLRGRQQCRLGVAILNYSWLVRDTDYAAEAKSYNRIRLLIGAGSQAPLTVCGGLTQFLAPQLAPVPQRITWRDKQLPPFAGKLLGFEAYNTERFELYNLPRARSAAEVAPVISGGGGFAPRWIAPDTVEVFARPEFTQTTSYWFLLRIADKSGRLRRLRLQPVWWGSANMTPSFFLSTDARRWRRLTPAAIEMRENGGHFTPELRLTPRQAAGCHIASAIPFLESDRQELLAWAREKLGAQVEQIGHSVLGRPIELLRVGSGGIEGPQIAVTCGQHSPGEIMGAHLLRPMLSEAQRLGLLQHCVFHLVPTVNVDCAHYGGNGLNARRRNTNRHWFNDIQPENQAVISYFEALRQDGGQVRFALDVHAGGIFRNHLLMHAQPTEVLAAPPEVLESQERWRDLLAKHCGLRRQDGSSLGLRHWRATDWFLSTFACPAFCLELSTCSYYDPEARRSRPFVQRSLDVVGTGLARSMAEMF